MSRVMIAAMATLLLTALAWAAVDPLPDPYRLEFDASKDLAQYSDKNSWYITVGMAVIKQGNPRPGEVYKIIIEEEGQKRFELDVPKFESRVVSEDIAVVLNMDTSGSMNEFGRLAQTQLAASTFIKALPPSADAGLIFFNHKVYHKVPPPADRAKLQSDIAAAKARGGTAYLDAAAAGIDMLQGRSYANRKRAVILITDGVDLNSDLTQQQVIAKAKQAGVPIYTVGIGKPGEMKPVSTVLVLDRSGSMQARANERDELTKIQALKLAAERFLNGISRPRRCAVLDFGDAPNPPSPFLSERFQLKQLIQRLKAEGETCLFDAVYDAVATLEADHPEGKRAVVALTDGIDNKSRRRVDEVIQFAQQAKVPLFLLGFGREGELDLNVMKRMAKQTGGFFFHAASQDKLIEYFEELATRIHDDGIDEVALKKLALETGGRYYPAKDVERLKMILETEVAAEITKEKQTLSKTFKSIREQADGVPRRVKVYLEQQIEVVDVTGKKTIKRTTKQVEEGTVNRGGLVIAEMDHFVYLGLLVLVGALVALPALLRRRAAAAPAFGAAPEPPAIETAFTLTPPRGRRP